MTSEMGDEHKERSYKSVISITFPVPRKGQDQWVGAGIALVLLFFGQPPSALL